MPDNLPSPESSFVTLPDHAVVSLKGADAGAFAQAQFANDVLALAEGHWQWNTWLTPKGRVVAVFALVKIAVDDLLLIVPDYEGDALSTSLGRFVFRRKVMISDRPELQVGAALQPPASARIARISRESDAVEIDYSGADGARTLRIGGGFPLASDEMVATWRSLDLRHGLVRLVEGQREQWTPQQLSLDRLQAYSVRKGCYPGQEIVARTHFLGKAKRALALLEGRQSAQPGAEVFADDRPAGSVVSASGSLALAVLPIERGSQTLRVDGQPVVEVPLSGGLGRALGES